MRGTLSRRRKNGGEFRMTRDHLIEDYEVVLVDDWAAIQRVCIADGESNERKDCIIGRHVLAQTESMSSVVKICEFSSRE